MRGRRQAGGCERRVERVGVRLTERRRDVELHDARLFAKGRRRAYHRSMDARRVPDPSEFLAAATPLLLRDEARHNLILGLAGTLRDQPDRYEEFRLWIVERRGEVTAAALQTPPYNLVLAQPADDQALEVLAAAIEAAGIELPGVVAAIPEADRFADAWESRRGTTRVRRMAQRIYGLTELRPPDAVPGNPRVATDDDVPLLVEWVGAFASEIEHDTPGPASDTERSVKSRLSSEHGGFMLWEDNGQAVSLAGWGAPTPSGIRIGPVYTPPSERSRGYGSAVTAAASQLQLAQGRRFCFLYTDLANPTSNSIYMRIGYEPVCDSVAYVFQAPSS
jgi:predicted GNAT family acetyltransferase